MESPIPSHRGRTVKCHIGSDISVSRIQFDAHQEIEPHSHKHACFGIIVAGASSETFDHRTFSLERGALLFRPAEAVHRDRVGQSGAECVAIELTEHFMALRAAGIPLSEPIKGKSEAAVQFGARLLQQMQFGDDLTPMAIEGITLELLAYYGRYKEPSHAPPAWLYRAREIIDDSAGRRLTLGEISQGAGVHPVHLAQVFRRHFGCTVGTYIRRRRIESAAIALRSSGRSIAEIALDCGFSDQAHLTSVFRAVMGVTPAAYRRQSGP
jgi:AraC family transcriptional regulator